MIRNCCWCFLRLLLLGLVFGVPMAVWAAAIPEHVVVRMPWPVSPGGFLTRWFVCGPFPAPLVNAQQPGYAFDFLTEYGGEAAIRPVPGLTHHRPDGTPVRWKPFVSDGDIIDFRKAFAEPAAQYMVGYAYTTIFRPSERKAYLVVGSDDGMQIWLNGTRVFDQPSPRPLKLNENTVAVTLRAGINHVLVKVSQATGAWNFALCVREDTRGILQNPGSPNHTDSLATVIAASSFEPGNKLQIFTDYSTKGRSPDTVELQVLAPGGQVMGRKNVQRGEQVVFDPATWPDGPYEVRCRCDSIGDWYPLTGHALWYKGKLLTGVQQLLDATPAKADTAEAMTHRLLAEMLRYRLGDKPAAIPEKQANAVCAIVFEYAELALARQGTSPVRPFGMVRLAYRDDIDGAPQFCRAYLPPEYDPAKKWPMLVILHGKTSDSLSYSQLAGNERRWDAYAERYNVIVIYAHGRGNTFYQGIGDRDVIRCVEMAKQRFSVDDDRVYLMGFSMGGAGSWHVGSHYPELFAALGPVFGGREYQVTTSDRALVKLSPYELYRLDRLKTSFVNAESLLTTPVFVNHGMTDRTVPLNISRYGVGMLQRWGYDVRYWEHTNKGHRLPLGCEDSLVEWLLQQQRVVDPPVVRVHAAELRYAHAHWLRIDQRERPDAFMSAEATVLNPTTICLDTRNVLQITLTPGPALVDAAKPTLVVWNGDVHTANFQGGSLTLRAAVYRAEAREKTAEVEGPFSDIYLTPFAIVQGTIAPDPDMREACAQAAQRLVKKWQTDQHWTPRFFLDTQITAADAARYSLILVGGAEENLLAQRWRMQIPLRITPVTIEIDQQVFSVSNAGVQLIYPHPETPGRYVAIMAATSPVGMACLTGKGDELDICIQDGRAQPWVAGGFFTRTWRLQETYIERGTIDE